MFNRILIAYDDSKEAGAALETGMKLAAAMNAVTTLLTVVEPLPGYVNMAGAVAPNICEELLHTRRDECEKLQAVARQQAETHGVKVQTMLVEAEEIHGIIDAARSTHADLLILGLRRHAPGIEWSGTVRRISNETPCPILAVPWKHC